MNQSTDFAPEPCLPWLRNETAMQQARAGQALAAPAHVFSFKPTAGLAALAA